MEAFFKPGQTVLFQGDSVTDCGRDFSDPNSLAQGYAGKVAAIYRTLFGNTVQFYNRGVSGNRSCDLLARYETDFKAIRPDFISILIGINDTWRRYDANDPTSPEQFEANYRQLLTQLRRDFPGLKIMMMEPFLLPSAPEKQCFREDLDPKIQVARSLAAQYADYYLPLDGILNAACVNRYQPKMLSEDGVHPVELGHSLIAHAYLRALNII